MILQKIKKLFDMAIYCITQTKNESITLKSNLLKMFPVGSNLRDSHV